MKTMRDILINMMEGETQPLYKLDGYIIRTTVNGHMFNIAFEMIMDHQY